MTKFKNNFSQEVWESTYKFGNEQTVDDTFHRIAKAVAAVEKDPIFWEQEFYRILSDFKFVPGGRIISNAGTGIQGTSLINCFVSNFKGTHQDSMEGIMRSLRDQALILKSEGGYGNSFNVLRPKGAYVEGIANETPGAVKMMELWDKQSEIITMGSGKVSDKLTSKKKIRKGAMMGELDVWHPEIEDFIIAKQTPGRLSKFNLSVGITDDFMTAVKNHDKWNLVFPDYEVCKSDYNEFWNGDLKAWINKGLPIKVYKTYDDANILWDLIIKSTYNRNEPGVLFVDTINKMNNLYYCEHIFTSNPCGEQPLPDAGVCLLSNINLTQYIKGNDWDYIGLGRDIPIMIRFMDNINEIANVPLAEQRESLQDKRRIGLGVMGYASGLLMLKQTYGSESTLKKTETLVSFIANTAYSASAHLAKEKGTFKLYDPTLYLQSKYLKVLEPTTLLDISSYGMRNSHLLSIAPTGNTSAYANNVSGGLEPLFATDYYRTYIIPEAPTGLMLPDKIDWNNKSGNTHGWVWIKEGDDNLLTTTFNGEIYKYDKNRGITKVVHIEDFGYAQLEDKTSPHIVTSGNLSIDAHIETMKVFAKYMDAAVSKTINVPANFSYEDFKDVYLRVYDTGYIKGCTTYREGTMMNVLSTSIQTTSVKNDAVKRPKKLSCDIHHLTVAGQKWIVLIGLIEPGKPYEVFAFKNKNINLSPAINKGHLTKIKSGQYNLELEYLTLENVTELFSQDEEEALTRMISMALRHNVDMKYITDQLNKAEGTIVSFSKAISRTLKKYIKEETTKELCPECGSSLIKVEGCTKCSSCEYSLC